jgi:hypothetical protein
VLSHSHVVQNCGSFTLHTQRRVWGALASVLMANILKDIVEDLYDIVSTGRIQDCDCLARVRFSSVRCA